MLAVLMGGGLVLFGVGGATSGGLVDAITGNGSSTSDKTYENNVTAAQKKTVLTPTSVIAWRDLARAEYQLAGIGDNFDTTTSVFTAKGKVQLKKADVAWERYQKLLGANGKVDATLANQMVQAYSADGLNQPAKAVDAIEDVLEVQPESAGLYAQLAIYAWTANQDRKGDLASAKAVALTAKDQRATFKAQLDAQKAAIASAAATAAGATTSGTDGAVTTTTG
jgi:predicted Zn-dependent protease